MAHRYAIRPLLALFALLAFAPSVRAAGGIGDLYVTSDASNVVRADDGATGAFIGVHCASVAPASGQLSVHFGANNGRMLGEIDKQSAIVNTIKEIAHVLTGRSEVKAKKKHGLSDLLARLKRAKK